MSNIMVGISTGAPAPHTGGGDMVLFVGALTGTTISGTMVRARNFSGLVNSNNEHIEGWPPTETFVTLTRQ